MNELNHTNYLFVAAASIAGDMFTPQRKKNPELESNTARKVSDVFHDELIKTWSNLSITDRLYKTLVILAAEGKVHLPQRFYQHLSLAMEDLTPVGDINIFRIMFMRTVTYKSLRLILNGMESAYLGLIVDSIYNQFSLNVLFAEMNKSLLKLTSEETAPTQSIKGR